MFNDRGMDKDKVIFVYSGILFQQKQELNYVFCRKIDAFGDNRFQ